MTLQWVRRNEDKGHRCPSCHSVAAWDHKKYGPRTVLRCADCGLRWRVGYRASRPPMRFRTSHTLPLFSRRRR